MTKRLFSLILLVLVAFVAGGVLWLRPLFTSRVYAGVTLEGVDLGGKSQAEVRQILALWQQAEQAKQISFYFGDKLFNLEPRQIDWQIDIEATVDEVWRYGRQGPLWERLKKIHTAKNNGYHVPVQIRYNETKLANLIQEWQEAIDLPPRNAALSLITGDIIPQEMGRQLETAAVKPLVIKALRQGDSAHVPLPVKPLYPAITVADIVRTGIKDRLSRYSTRFDPADANRASNIRLAARKINGYIVFPGQTFSFNETVGPRDKAHGFKEALEIVDGEFVPGIGGGVCQVSSTLYNAALLANMTIVERYNHSKPLGYVPMGRDATVVYGVLDLKFSNNTNTPIMIMAQTVDDQLHVGIFGQKPPAQSVELATLEQKVIPPSITKKPDSELFLGETKVVKQGKPGYEVTTARIVYVNGREVKREIVSRDRYLPEDTIVMVGAKLPPFALENSTGESSRERDTDR